MDAVPFLSRKLPSEKKTADAQATVILGKRDPFLGTISVSCLQFLWDYIYMMTGFLVKTEKFSCKCECYKMCGYLATGRSNIWILDSVFPFSPNIFITWKTPIKKRSQSGVLAFLLANLYLKWLAQLIVQLWMAKISIKIVGGVAVLISFNQYGGIVSSNS